MGRFIYCRFCDEPYFSIAGKRPAICRGCKRRGNWTTVPPRDAIPTEVAPDAVRPFELTDYDREFFLPRIFIAPD